MPQSPVTVRKADGSERLVRASWFKASTPATAKQARFIELLASKLGERVPEYNTKHQAHLTISQMRAKLRRRRRAERKRTAELEHLDSIEREIREGERRKVREAA